MLADRRSEIDYDSDRGDLVESFYIPALESAVRYDRITGYFSAGALALAARGVEGLVRNNGRMRLLVGHELKVPEIEAIQKGESLREVIERRFAEPLDPPDAEAEDGLELLSWMVSHRHLEVRVAIPHGSDNESETDSGLFHAKSGIIEDRAKSRLAWSGSINETRRGWTTNWEWFLAFCSWKGDPAPVDVIDRKFERLWAGEAERLIVLDIPEAARRELLQWAPKEGLPKRLRRRVTPVDERRRRVWSFLRRAPALPDGGRRVGEATAAVTPWPHQLRAFERLHAAWPPRLLIADEVGLGKTIQAGLLLRQAWLEGRAERVLILAPSAVLGQWQLELREKFNLDWPIYDGRNLRYSEDSVALRGLGDRVRRRDPWHDEPAVIASSQLMRRKDRARTLIDDARRWDLIVLDEAHHARRRAPGGAKFRSNALLRLMRELSQRTDGLVLMTATPMQIHPVEVWDLLDLLGLPPEWTEEAFLDFFRQIRDPFPPPEALEQMATLFRAVERDHGEVTREAAVRLTGLSEFDVDWLFEALRDSSPLFLRQLESPRRKAARRVMGANTPIRPRMSRHTRPLLRRYAAEGKVSGIASRSVQDRFIPLSAAERRLYEAVDDHVATVWSRAGAESGKKRSAVGFVMTVYRRRLASSFAALRSTLTKRRDAVGSGASGAVLAAEDLSDDETLDDIPDDAEAASQAKQAAEFEAGDEIEALLAAARALPPDTKLGTLFEVLDELRSSRQGPVMVFTQYLDTMDFLRSALLERGGARVLCLSGRGGEIPDDGASQGWQGISRDEVKGRFREGEAEVLVCTDAASEGLNFQFCGGLVNYDMPWNPMRVEQRIGRIDRVGQKHSVIRVVNLYYEDTVEADVYRALSNRVGLFREVVGPVQPILAQMPGLIAEAVLRGRRTQSGRVAVEDLDRLMDTTDNAFDLDAAVGDGFDLPDRPRSPVSFADLDRVIRDPGLMPPGCEVRLMGAREYSLRLPEMQDAIRVTTDPDYYLEHPESVELWSPGSPFFRPPDLPLDDPDFPPGATLGDILDE